MSNYFLMWFTIIMVHELGHILTYVMFMKRLPVVKIKWYGIVIEEDQCYDFSPLRLYIVAIAGILAGYIVLNMPQSYAVMNRSMLEFKLNQILYLSMCIGDIITMINISSMGKYPTYLEGVYWLTKDRLGNLKKVREMRIEKWK